MARLDVASVLCVVLTLLPTSLSVPFDVGLCPDWNFPCQCGTTGFQFDLKIKQCSGFYRWELQCKPCQNIDENAICQRYRHCFDCQDDIDGCSSCPIGRYGRWCLHECNCQNGGSCDTFGRCICVGNFRGNKCEIPIVCSKPRLSENVTVLPDESTYAVESIIRFRCKEGFLLDGPTEAECWDNERWSKGSPRCLHLCPALPSPEHGSADLPLGKIVPGQIVHFLCDKSFALSGPSKRRCQEDGTWSFTQPTCVPSIECPQPNIPANSIILESSSKSPFSPGSTLSIQCQNGLVLVGKEKMICQDNGKWSHQASLCVPDDQICVGPRSLINGKIKVEDGIDGGEVYIRGTRLRFTCEPLYFMAGSTEAVCSGNRTWSALLPTCQKVTTCSALDSLPNGYINFAKPKAAARAASRTFSPLSGTAFNMSRRTGKVGRFRPNTRPQTAEALKPLQQASLKMTLPEGFYHVGTQAAFECESQYYKLEGSGTRTCDESGEWSGRPTTCIPLCGRSSDPRAPYVTKGTASNVGQWPWVVGISRLTVDGHYAQHCGASLLEERWVITAAHCVTYEDQITLLPKDELQFYAGKYYLDDNLNDTDVQVRKAEAIHVHYNYDPFSYDSDIALIRLSQPVRLTSRVQPVCLPSADPIESQERLKDGTRGVVIGWGATEEKDNSDLLLHAQVPVVSTNTCIQGYKEADLNVHISSKMFCAGHEAGGRDACDGDSGGPLVFLENANSNKFILEGIVSWGSPIGCGNEKQYSGYVRVQRFVEWIRKFV